MTPGAVRTREPALASHAAARAHLQRGRRVAQTTSVSALVLAFCAAVLLGLVFAAQTAPPADAQSPAPGGQLDDLRDNPAEQLDENDNPAADPDAEDGSDEGSDEEGAGEADRRDELRGELDECQGTAGAQGGSPECNKAVDEALENGGGESPDEAESEGGGFARPANTEPAYKAYDADQYEFAFYVAEDDQASFYQAGKKTLNAISDMLNSIASIIFIVYVLFMKGSVTALEWVLGVNLVENLRDAVSDGISSMGNTLIGDGNSFSSYVKLVWALGAGAIIYFLFRARVALALGSLLKMLVVTALAAIIILKPGDAIDLYTDATNAASNTVLSMAAGEEGGDPENTVTEEYLDEMWEAYVIIPFGQIQVSSDTGVAKEYGEQALATDPEERPYALEGIKDEEGVEDRAQASMWVMHVVWAMVTLIFGLCAGLLLLAVSAVVLVFQFIALIAFMTLPIWLWFAIFPAAGVTEKLLGWFINLNLDVIFAKLMLALFVVVNTAILGISLPSEDMSLILRFLISLLSGIAAIMFVFGLRGVIQASSFGRSGMGGGGLTSRGLSAASLLASGGGLASTASGVAGNSGKSAASGADYAHPAVAKKEREVGEVGAGRGSKDKLGKMAHDQNEASRAEKGESPIDGRSGKRKAADAGKRGAAAAGKVGWQATKAGGRATGRAGRIGKEAAKRLPKAGIVSAQSGFSPMETTAAFGGVGAAAGFGAAWGAAGATKDKAKDGVRSLAARRRQNKEEKAQAERFAAVGEELTEKTGARMEEDLVQRDDAVEEDARQAYINENPQTRREESDPGSGGSANPYKEDAFPERPPEGVPEDASYDPQTGVISGTHHNPGTEEPPRAPEGYTRHMEPQESENGELGSRYVFTPDSDAKTMRGQAYDQAEGTRRASRERGYAMRPGAGSYRPDGQGSFYKDGATPEERARDAREDQMRDSQRDRIVDRGYSNFDDFHAAKKQDLADQGYDVTNYAPEKNAPPPEGERPGQSAARSSGQPEAGTGQSMSGGASGRAHPTAEQIKQNDPEGFAQYYNPRASGEFSSQEYKAMKEAKSRRADPARSQGSWDQTYLMEAASQRVQEGIRNGDSNEAIIAGMKEPEEKEGQPAKKFQDRLRHVNDTWLRNGPGR